MSVPTFTLNNGVEMPGPRVRRLPDPAGGDDRRRRDGAGDRLPPHRHRRGVRQRAGGRRGHPPLRAVDRDEVFVETKIWISDYGYDETLHALRQERGQARRRPDRPADPAPGAARRVRADPRRLPGAGEAAADGKVRAIGVSNFMPDHLDRAARGDRGGAGGQPDRGAPVLPAVRGARRPTPSTASSTQAWSPIGGITFYRDGATAAPSRTR